ncbi:MAG: redoxin domain-containing protein [Planctomycetota bacterium]
MSRVRLIVACLFAAVLTVYGAAKVRAVKGEATKPKTSVGREVPEQKLRDFRGKEHEVKIGGDTRAAVVVFIGTHCPLAKLYGPRLSELEKRYAKKGVAFFAIDSNRQDTLQHLSHYATKHGITFPVLKDGDHSVSDAYGAERTPEAFVLDAKRVVRFQGRIDDQYGVGYSRPKANVHHVADALDDLLAGRKVRTPYVEPVGCIVGRAPKKAPKGSVTYSKHIAPILNRSCVECHREGEIAPFPLTNYDEVAGWAETILEVIDDGRMPPWHANPAHGKFKNDSRLADADKKLIYSWVDDGTPEGNPKDLPKPPTFATGWRIDKPDAVIRMPRAFEVPAEGTVPYQYFSVDPGWKEGRWVKVAEAIPDARSVVHHIILFFVPPGAERYRDQLVFQNMIASMAPGLPPTRYVDGAAKYVPKGSKLMFQMHYTPDGSKHKDQSHVGLIFAKDGEVKKEVRSRMAVNFRFRIPPGADNHRVESGYRFGRDSQLISLLPHMHLRGKSFRYTAMYPTGKQEILLDVPKYDFNWQNVYTLAEPKKMPAGTVIRCVAHFDNSEGNLANPDPTDSVRWGDQTWEEMMLGALDYVIEDQDLSRGPQAEKKGNGLFLVSFRFQPKKDPKTVHLVGSFNEWNKTSYPLEKQDDGSYVTKIALRAGDHEYKFLVDGESYFADPGSREAGGRYNNSVLSLSD